MLLCCSDGTSAVRGRKKPAVRFRGRRKREWEEGQVLGLSGLGEAGFHGAFGIRKCESSSTNQEASKE